MALSLAPLPNPRTPDDLLYLFFYKGVFPQKDKPPTEWAPPRLLLKGGVFIRDHQAINTPSGLFTPQAGLSSEIGTPTAKTSTTCQYLRFRDVRGTRFLPLRICFSLLGVSVKSFVHAFGYYKHLGVHFEKLPAWRPITKPQMNKPRPWCSLVVSPF